MAPFKRLPIEGNLLLLIGFLLISSGFITSCSVPFSTLDENQTNSQTVTVSLFGIGGGFTTRSTGLSSDLNAAVVEVSVWDGGNLLTAGTLLPPANPPGPWTGQLQLNSEGSFLFEAQVFDADRVLLYDDFTIETISPSNRSITITTSSRRPSTYLGTVLEPRPRPYPYSLEAPQEGWQRGSRFYHVWISGFHDTNGDGVGDISGVTAKLQHIKDLGFNGFWLSPFFLSPSITNSTNKHGYDAKDFYEVDPVFGTKEDLRKLLIEAHKLGLKVLLDYVPNHSSDEHVWFQKSLANSSDKRSWYVWQDYKPSGWVAWDGTEDWYRVGTQNLYYYALFPMPIVEGETPPTWSKMPDLNYETKAVRSAMADVIAYWMNFGFDGMRVDAIPYAFEGPSHLPATYEYQGKSYQLYRHWRKEVLDTYGPLGYHKFMVGENYHDKDSSYFASKTANLFSFIGPGDTSLPATDLTDGGFQMAFDFQYRWRLDGLLRAPSVNLGNTNSSYTQLLKDHAVSNDTPRGSSASFLSNHDEFFERIAYTYPERGRQRLGVALQALGPHIPFYYYGTEARMTYPTSEVYRPNDRRLRKMIDWSIVESEKTDAHSILNWTKALYQTRAALSQSGSPGYTAFVDPSFETTWSHFNNDVYSYAVKNTATGDFVWVVMNLSGISKSNHAVTMHSDVRFTSAPQTWIGAGTASVSGSTLTLNGTLPARAIRVYAAASPPGSVTSSNPGDVGGTSSQTSLVTFQVNYSGTTFGESVYIVGSTPELGEWTPVRAIPMSGQAYPIWTATLELPRNQTMTFKFIKMSEEKFHKNNPNDIPATWEGGADRSFTVPNAATGSYGPLNWQ